MTIVKATCFCPRPHRVDHDRIRDVGPDRAASEWLLRCGAMVRYHGQQRWQKDYNHLPTGPLDKYKIQAIDATDSCIMSIGFDHMGKSSTICYGKCRWFAMTFGCTSLTLIVIWVSFSPFSVQSSLYLLVYDIYF